MIIVIQFKKDKQLISTNMSKITTYLQGKYKTRRIKCTIHLSESNRYVGDIEIKNMDILN